MLGQFCERLTLLSLRWKLALTAGAVLAPAAIICTAGAALGVRLNLTNSVPIGLYVISDGPEARLVEFCPPEPFATLSRERGYRERSQFGCPDGARPLLKPIAATAGDLVNVSPRGIEVNGKLIPHTAALHNDSAGRSIAAWPMGTYQVRKGSIWVASSFNTHSFDSRYFGPVPASAVLHQLRPLCVSQ
jgi:conjugative transfer signal peptidase TraF